MRTVALIVLVILNHSHIALLSHLFALSGATAAARNEVDSGHANHRPLCYDLGCPVPNVAFVSLGCWWDHTLLLLLLVLGFVDHRRLGVRLNTDSGHRILIIDRCKWPLVSSISLSLTLGCTSNVLLAFLITWTIM